MNHTVSVYRSRLKLFFVSLGVAIAMVVASGFFISNVLTADTEGVTASNESCVSTMRANGFNPNFTGEGALQVVLATTSSIESLVYQSGVIIASCPAYTLTDYCAGAGCQKPGVTFTLKPKEL